MTDQTRPLAVGLMPLENRHDAIIRVATRADQLGYFGFFLPETWAHATTVLLAACAARTQQIHVGATVLGTWGRSAATIAMASSTLDAVSDGRFILGLGSSTPQLTEGLHDVPYGSPYEKMRQSVTQVRALLRGERTPLVDAPEARPLALNLEPRPEIPILLAASSPTTMRLAGELCDGWVPFLYPRDSVKDGVALLHLGRAKADTELPEPLVYAEIPTVVAEDEQKAREGAAWFVAFYIMMMGPIYRNTLARLGFAKEVELVQEANADRRPAIVPSEADVLLEQLTIYGTPEQARAQLSAWYDAGATVPGLLLAPNLSDEEIDFALEACQPSANDNAQ
jgi:alkanesulfonate monooxygenase SsuD/methylene tetrahydromethanopterin reductase-like flavin-dependent oxidoreductase (luciferase family)